MSEMIERVARALCEDFGLPPDYIYVAGSCTPPGEFSEARPPIKNWTRFIPQAKTAIKAMREATKAMCEWPTLKEIPQTTPPLYSLGYQRMIDAALSEPIDTKTALENGDSK